jgi:methylated-DNA-[protein]-cysteine S-methyltransferase
MPYTHPSSTAILPGGALRTTATIDSPVGPLTLTATDGVLSRLHMVEQRHLPPDPPDNTPDPADRADAAGDRAGFAEVVGQLSSYFRGELTRFELQLALVGTAFQLRVWAALQEIPYGETVSYGELAREIGRPSASRAVGLANGRNPIAIIVPCHRVVGADGTLTGYGGGLERKQMLLDLERRHARLF